VPKKAWQDPSALRTGKAGRDGCRVPLPWAGTEPPYDFGPAQGQPWIPQPTTWGPLTVAAQDADPDSTLAFYRRALEARKEYAVPAGDEVQVTVVKKVLTFVRGDLLCHLNTGTRAVPAPEGDVLLCSGTTPGGPDTATWIRRR